MLKSSINSFIKTHITLGNVADQLQHLSACYIHPSAAYRDWIGINFNKDFIESVKFYFSFYDINSVTAALRSGIIGKHATAKFEELFKGSPAMYINSFTEYGSGITFSLKWDKEGNKSAGIYYRLKKPGILPFEDILTANQLNDFTFEDSKGVFILQENDTEVYYKYYFYSSDLGLKKKLGGKLNLASLFSKSEKLEISCGKGNILNNSDNDLKVILLGNESEISKLYLEKYCFEKYKKEISLFSQETGFGIYCPAFYNTTTVQSCYFFNIVNTPSQNITRTVNKMLHEGI